MSGIRITKPSANPRTRVLICILSLEVSVPVGSDRRANGFELSRPARYSASYSKFTNQDLDYQIAQRAGSAARMVMRLSAFPTTEPWKFLYQPIR